MLAIRQARASRNFFERCSSTFSNGGIASSEKSVEIPIGTSLPPKNPSGLPLSKILTPTFPLSYKESFQIWKDRAKLQEAQDKVMSFLPFSEKADELGRQSSSKRVIVNDSGDYINEFHVQSSKDNSPRHVVLLHGYGAGLGFFYRTIEDLSRSEGWSVHAIDLLGYGLSSRPEMKIKSKDVVNGTLEAENWFIDSLEAWRKSRKIEKFTLIAHSLGAYIGSQYAIQYPDKVDKIMLVSPAAVDRNPQSIPLNELKHTLKAGEVLTDPLPSTHSSITIPGWFKFLWERNVSPFSLVRYTGPLGPRFTSGWTAKRFSSLPTEESNALLRYAYSIFNARGSGEYLLNYLLAPGGYGRWPLSERLGRLSCPSLWVYGDRDWMDAQGGRTACANIRANNGPETRFTIIKNSGHHIYFDNRKEFGSLAMEFMNNYFEKPTK